jgi:HD-GYP domain-containing protein (c-di-GMP phosphodiesterase class II)
MSLVRRRFHPAGSQDALASIADLLAEFRSSPSQEQITNRILHLIQRLILLDATAILIHDPVQGFSRVVDGLGYWRSLKGRQLSLPHLPPNRPGAWPDDQPLRNAFPGEDQKSVQIVSVPLTARETMVGSLIAGRIRRRDTILSTRDLQLLSAVADIGAGAFHQAGLSERISRQDHQILAMRSVSRAISSSLDLKVTLNVFLDLVVTQLEVDAADVLIQDPQSRDLTLAASRGFQNPIWQHSRVRMEHDLASTAILERRTTSRQALKNEDPALGGQNLMSAEGFLGYHATPLIVHGEVRGVLEVFRRTAGSPDCGWTETLEALALQCAIAVDNAQVFDQLQRTHSELTLACDSTIAGWSRAVDLRAQEVEGHSQRVSDLSLRLAERMGVPPDQWLSIRRGALLHDIGKIGVPDRVLWKPGSLSEEEWKLMRRHPAYAEEILSPIEFLRPAMDIPRYHHERWDGQGYPFTLAGKDIPLSARLFSVVDVWDSLLAQRPFRQAWNNADTIRYLRENAGSHFDPDAVEAFIPILKEYEQEPPLAG